MKLPYFFAILTYPWQYFDNHDQRVKHDLILLMLLRLYFALNVKRIYNALSTFSYTMQKVKRLIKRSKTSSQDLLHLLYPKTSRCAAVKIQFLINSSKFSSC